MLDRPAALNALSTAMLAGLARACDQVAADGEVRAVLLTAAGERAFCVGADLKERAAMTDEQILAQRPVFRAAFGALLGLPQPVIAAVHGFALGGGCELALSCDIIVADETAVFGLPETSVGLVPGCGGTQLATRRLGPGRAADLVLTGRRLDAAEAERIGLADRRVPAGGAVECAMEPGPADRGQLPGRGARGQAGHPARRRAGPGRRAGGRGRRLADGRAVRRPPRGHRRVRGQAIARLAASTAAARNEGPCR